MIEKEACYLLACGCRMHRVRAKASSVLDLFQVLVADLH